MAYLTLIALLCGSGVVFYLMLVWAYARTLMRPARMTPGRALAVLGRMGPSDLSFLDSAWSEHTFVVPSPVRPGTEDVFKGWWFPAPADSTTTVLMVHGFADSRIGTLAWVRPLHEAGANVMLIDLRAHGDSPGPACSAGHWERYDILHIARQVRTRWPEQAGRLIGLGASLGGVCTAAASALDRSEAVPGVPGGEGVKAVPAFDALVLDSPAGHYRMAVAAFSRIFNMPGPWVQAGALRVLRWWTGVDLDEVAILTSLDAIGGVPILMIAPKGDPYLDGYPADPPVLEGILARHSNVRVWNPECAHLMAVSQYPAEYVSQVQAFLASLPA